MSSREIHVTYNNKEILGECIKEGPCTKTCKNVDICPYWLTHMHTCKRTCYRIRCLSCEYMRCKDVQ